MSQVSIPAGQSLREVAERLGVSVDELQKHAGVSDAEAPQEVERRFEIPDGFFRVRDRDRRSTMAAVPSSHLQEGLNSVVALEMEYRRTLVSGSGVAATDEERDALAEARRAFERYEPASNALAIDLWQALTKSRSIPVRAEAFAGQGIAHALRNIIYGEPAQTCRKAALSAAKSAQMADPKRPEAHLAMGLALWVGGAREDAAAARDALERAAALGEGNAACWCWLAARLREDGEADTAHDAVAIALELAPNFALALERAALLALDAIDLDRAETLLRAAASALPTYANPTARLAALRSARGHSDESAALLDELLGDVEDEAYREHLGRLGGRADG